MRAHLERLVELECLELRHGRLGSSFVYELMMDADAPEEALHIGLIGVAELGKLHAYGGRWRVLGWGGVRAKTGRWGGVAKRRRHP